MPMTVIAGPDHTREPSEPVPTSGWPSTTSASARNSSASRSAAGPLLAPQPLDGDVAVRRRRSVESARMSAMQRVGCGTAVLAAVLGRGERARLDGDVRHAAQRDGQRGHAGPHAAHVGDDHRVDVEQLGVLGGIAR